MAKKSKATANEEPKAGQVHAPAGPFVAPRRPLAGGRQEDGGLTTGEQRVDGARHGVDGEGGDGDGRNGEGGDGEAGSQKTLTGR